MLRHWITIRRNGQATKKHPLDKEKKKEQKTSYTINIVPSLIHLHFIIYQNLALTAHTAKRKAKVEETIIYTTTYQPKG